MAIDPAVANSTSTVSYGSRSNTAPAAPAGIAAGQFALLGLYTEGNVAVTVPTGCTLIVNVDDANTDGDLFLAYKRVTGSETEFAWTHATASTEAWVKLLTGVVTSGDPEDAVRSTANPIYGAGPITLPAISAANAGSLICGYVCRYSGGTWSSPSLTSRISQAQEILMADVQAGSGDTGAKTVTWTGSDNSWGVLFAIKAEPAGGASLTPTVGAGTLAGIAGRMDLGVLTQTEI